MSCSLYSLFVIDRENRYLLFLTENYAALDILKQYLQDQDGGHHMSDSTDSSLEPWRMQPFVLFGSSFPKDKEYTQVNTNCSFFSMLSLNYMPFI